MNSGSAIALLLTLLAGGVMAEALPPLPRWSPSDFERLKKGELIPGEDFFKAGTEPSEIPVPVPELPPEPKEEELPTEIAEQHLRLYFDAKPRGYYLVDPQELLSRQEYRDRESFLQYHAGESDIDLYVYLFDARQELPSDTTIDSIFAKYFEGDGPAVIVFYYLGMPERARMAVSSEVRAVASEEEQGRALKTAVHEAFEKSDPGSQLDNFSVELSIRLYWFEKEILGVGSPSMERVPERPVPGDELPSMAEIQRDQKRWKMINNAVLGMAFLVTAGGLGWIGRYIADRRVRYVFPEVDAAPLLGAPHAAGVGAVVSFSSAQLPPSQQRDQVPDYLQRM